MFSEEFTSIVIDEDSIIKVIRLLNIGKVYGFDEIFTHMLKVCDSAISKPLLLVFQNCINRGEFLGVWKKSKFASSLKNDKKHINYPLVFFITDLKNGN